MSRTALSTNAPIDCSRRAVAGPAPSAARTIAGTLLTSDEKRAWFGASWSQGRQAANIAPLRSCTTVGITRWSTTRCCVNCETAFHQRASWPHATSASEASVSSVRSSANAVRASNATAGTSTGASDSSGSAANDATSSHALRRSLGSGNCPRAVSAKGRSSDTMQSVTVPSPPTRGSSLESARARSSVGAMAVRSCAAVSAYGCVPAAMAACPAGRKAPESSPQARSDPLDQFRWSTNIRVPMRRGPGGAARGDAWQDSDCAGIRTQDLAVKSRLLYQLSYAISVVAVDGLDGRAGRGAIVGRIDFGGRGVIFWPITSTTPARYRPFLPIGGLVRTGSASVA